MYKCKHAYQKQFCLTDTVLILTLVSHGQYKKQTKRLTANIIKFCLRIAGCKKLIKSGTVKLNAVSL